MASVTDEIYVGSVLSRATSILYHNFMPFCAITLIVTAPPSLLYWAFTPIEELGESPNSGIQWLFNISVIILGSLLNYVVTGILVYGTVQALKGHNAGLGECIGRGFSTIWRIIGLSLVAGLVTGLGFVLMIVPGFILIVNFWVAVPVAVIEDRGVGNSLRRSSELTNGHGWKVFGIVIVVFVVFYGLAWVFKLVMIAFLLAVEPEWFRFYGLAVDVAIFLASAVGTALIAVAVAVSYHDLRVVKEGIDIDEIAAVFD